MLKPDPRISLADLSAVGVRLSGAQAVSLVREVALRVTRGELPGVPSAHVLRLSSDGGLFVEGPVAADDRAVVRAAHLLDTLLPGFDAPPGFRVPGALRLVVARALGTLDLPAYPSLQAFAEALERFGLPDPAAVVRTLFASWAASVESPTVQTVEADVVESVPALAVPIGQDSARQEANVHALARQNELTISDIRRARRATGLTLGEVAKRSRIPVWLLRELEWGYLRNWPGGLYGRTQLLRYARGAGLDGELVIRTVWPMLQDNTQQGIEPATMAFGDEAATVEVTVLPVLSEAPIMSEAPLTAEPERVAANGNPRRNRWLAALAIPALIAIGVVPALWDRDSTTPAAPATEITASSKPAESRTTAATPQRSSDRPASHAPAAEETKAAARTAAAKQTSPIPLGTSGDNPHPQRGIPDGPAYSPAFASVGSAMFYHSDEDGHASLMRADTDSRGAVLRITSVVDDTARNFHARPSPDGTRIAFDSDREGERAVYVADSDGRNVRRISGEGFAAIPSWSPDGTSLAYVRAEDGKPNVWNLWISDLESGRTRRVTSFKYGQPWGGSWFPDGRRIAYSHEDRLFIRDLATGRERIFKSPVTGRLVRTPAVSPDGRRIMFQVMRDGAWLLDVPDGSMRKILSDPSAEEYTWAPDGRRVAYHSRRSGEWGVWVMAAR